MGHTQETKDKISASRLALGLSKTPTKTCPRCKGEFARSYFGYRPNGATESYCPPCKKAYHREKEIERYRNHTEERREQRRNSSRNSRFKKNYGITLEDYIAMRDAQGNKCMICPTVGTDQKWLVVDHNHATGAVRGLLCANCNCGIGYLQDSPEVLRSAIVYLKRFA